MKLPPYAKSLLELRRNPEHWATLLRAFTVHVFCGSKAWQEAQNAIRAGWGFVLLPPGENPEGYDWSVCAGYDPVLICVHGNMAAAVFDRLGRALIRDGVTRALCIGDSDPFVFVAKGHKERAA